MQAEILELKNRMQVISDLPEYLFISNEKITGIPEQIHGSYEHAMGLVIGLQNAKLKGTIYLLDPDFFILQNNWLEKTAKYLEYSQTGYSGAMYDPSDAKQWVDFPCFHFFYFKEKNINEVIENLMPAILGARKSNEKIEFYKSMHNNLSNSREPGFELRLKKLHKSVFLNIQNGLLLPFLVSLAIFFKKRSPGKRKFFYRTLISIGIIILRLQQKKQGIILVHGSTQRSKKLLRQLQSRVRPILNSKIAYRVIILEQQARMTLLVSDFTWSSGIEIYFLNECLFAFHLRSTRNGFKDLDISNLEALLLK
jgi:hypothetical protein